MDFTPREVYLVRDDKFSKCFIDFVAFPGEIRRMVYRFTFKRTNICVPRKPSMARFSGDYTNRFSTLLQTSKQVYNEAEPLLYSENSFFIHAGKDCFKPFIHSLLEAKFDTLFQLRDLAVHVVKLSNIKGFWKVLCGLPLTMLTLNFGYDGQPSRGQGRHDPILAVAQMLHLTKICPEADLPQFRINVKTVIGRRTNKFNSAEAYRTFASTDSSTGAAGRCSIARRVLLKCGLTMAQLDDLPHAASSHITGWYLNEVADDNKDTENKENELEEKKFLWLKQ